MNVNDYKYCLTNRNKKRKAKSGIFWCYGCDCYLVSEYSKCKICKTRNGRKRDKK